MALATTIYLVFCGLLIMGYGLYQFFKKEPPPENDIYNLDSMD